MIYLLVLTLCALAITAVSETSFGGILLLIVAGLLPRMLDTVPAVSWVIGQNVVFTLVLQTISGTTVEEFTLVAMLSLASPTVGITLGASV